MSKEVKRRHYSIINIVFPFIIGSIFIALAIGILVSIIKSYIKFDGAFDWFTLVPIVLFVILPISLGSVALYFAGKDVYHWIMEFKTKKRGFETTAYITDYKTVSHNKRQNTRYSLVLSYKDENNDTKTFKTNYIFEINEFKQLRALNNIKVKVYKNFVAVVEPFTEDTYKLDSKYHIELEFYKQKPVAITLKIWRICCIAAIILLIISIILTTTLNNGIYLIISVGLLFAANMPFAIILSIYLIRWIWGNDKTKFKQNKYKRKLNNRSKK